MAFFKPNDFTPTEALPSPKHILEHDEMIVSPTQNKKNEIQKIGAAAYKAIGAGQAPSEIQARADRMRQENTDDLSLSEEEQNWLALFLLDALTIYPIETRNLANRNEEARTVKGEHTLDSIYTLAAIGILSEEIKVQVFETAIAITKSICTTDLIGDQSSLPVWKRNSPFGMITLHESVKNTISGVFGGTETEKHLLELANK